MVTAAIWLIFVAAAVRPPLRRGPFAYAVFVATMSINEIPSVLLAAFVTSMLFGGRPAGPVEIAGTGVLAGATVAGLIWLQVRAGAARATLERGLDRGLGPDRRTERRADDKGATLPPIPWWPGVLLPFQRRDRRVTRRRNLAYGPDAANHVDLYRGRATGSARPVLIHLHGGGFVSGGKSRESVTMLNQLAAHGWLCLSGNYRLRGQGQHPNPLIDTKRLIAWTRAHAQELGADPGSIFIAGCSAGAHLAVSAALTPGQAWLQPGFEDADTTVAAAIALYGYLGPRTAAPDSSPALLADADAPPVLIIHGRNDTAVPVDHARAVAEHLARASRNPVAFIELPGTQHSFDRFGSVRARITADAVEAFLDWARQRG